MQNVPFCFWLCSLSSILLWYRLVFHCIDRPSFIYLFHQQILTSGEFPGGLMVRAQHFHCCGLGSIPDLGTVIVDQATAHHGKKKKKKKKNPKKKGG